MKRVLASVLALAAVSSSPVFAQDVPVDIHTELTATAYPYAVHKPAGANPPANPPLNIFLHGMGSRATDPGIFKVVIEWNGVGRRLKEYYTGNQTQAAVLAAEQFLTVMPILPMTDDTDPEFDPASIKAILDAVSSSYTFDSNRVFLTGYSCGSRSVWKILPKYPNVFAAAGAAAGVGNATTTDFPDMAKTPIQIYVGSTDYDGSSNLDITTKFVQAFNASTPNLAEMVVIPGPDPQPSHNSMANAPFQLDHFQWLLQQDITKNGAMGVGIPSNSSSTSSRPSSSSSPPSSPTSVGQQSAPPTPDTSSSAPASFSLSRPIGLLAVLAAALWI